MIKKAKFVIKRDVSVPTNNFRNKGYHGKYPFAHMKINEYFEIEVDTLKKTAQQVVNNLNASLGPFKKKYKKDFECKSLNAFIVRCTRIRWNDKKMNKRKKH
jgi:hypothetical protein